MIYVVGEFVRPNILYTFMGSEWLYHGDGDNNVDDVSTVVPDDELDDGTASMCSTTVTTFTYSSSPSC